MYSKLPKRACRETPVSTITAFKPDEISKSFTLNPRCIESKRDVNFKQVTGIRSCPSTQYYKDRDGRLISPVRGVQTTTLNQIPITGSVSEKDILDSKELNTYGQKYTSYKDIDAGQITYYIDKDTTKPYFKPNFIHNTVRNNYLYKDPMTSVKPEYPYYIGYKFNNPVKDLQLEGGLTFMNDTLSFREDLMSRQMRKMNQQRYESRWYE
jgi:hypothetical protein